MAIVLPAVMAIGRVALLLAGFWGLWLLGRALRKLRSARPKNTIRYDDILLVFAVAWAAFGIFFATLRLLHVHGWEGNGPWGMVIVSFCSAIFLFLVVFRYAVVITSDAILVRGVVRPGWRRVEWSSVRSWQAGRKPGTIVLQLEPSGNFELGAAFKEGFDALPHAIRARKISQLQ